jgi:radical SAM superfamily enzyme YgiQ (UPF0313 family)
MRIQTINVNPLNDEENFYLPYFDLIVRALFDKTEIEFSFPYVEDDSILDDSADIYLFSCYVWNFNAHLSLAKLLKLKRPDALVVFGGPQIYREMEIQEYVDLWSDGRIEDLVPEILSQFAKVDFSRGWTVPKLKGATPYSFEKDSPYLKSEPFLQEFIRERQKGRKLFAFWETTRGCPYKCQFCDWGGYTNSKIITKEVEILKREIRLFSQLHVIGVKALDANFGILKRDEDIIKEIGLIKKETGYPQFFSWVPSKNQSKNIVKIARLAHESKLDEKIIRIDLQSTDENILINVERSNIKNEELTLAIKEISSFNKVGTGIILGLPGENKDTFKKTIYDIIKLGIEDEFEVYPFSLLPNAPANEKTYKTKYKIKTATVPLHRESTAPPSQRELENLEKIVVSTQSYSSEDWVEMNVWSSLIQAFHKYGLLRFVASFSGSIEDFYESFFSVFNDNYNQIGDRLSDHFNEYLKGKRVNRIRFKDDIWLSPDRWAFYEILSGYLDFYEFVEAIYPQYFEAINFHRAFLVPLNEERIVEFNGNSFHYNFESLFRKTFPAVSFDNHYKEHMKRLYGPKGPRGFYKL